MGNEQGKLLDTTTPEGVQAMDDHLQKKFSKGIQYNSKICMTTLKSHIFHTQQCIHIHTYLHTYIHVCQYIHTYIREYMPGHFI